MADTLASYGKLARYKEMRRIRVVNDTTILGAGGEYSDFQYINQLLRTLTIRDFTQNDGSVLTPREIWSYLTRVLYNRRSKFNPLWNELVTAGFRDGESFLGYTDLYGSAYEENMVATGYGQYLAMPLLRKEWKEGMTEEEAKTLLHKCMRVLFYRDCRTINKLQCATITKDGAKISDPYAIDTEWECKLFVRSV